METSIVNCPHCGAMEQPMGHLCAGCGRLVGSNMPNWARQGKRRGIFGRDGYIFVTQNKLLFLALSVLVLSAITWHNYHFVPNPVSLIRNQPSSDLTSLSQPGQWSMASYDYERTRHVPNPPSLPQGRLLWSSEEGLLKSISLPAIADGTVFVGNHFEFLALDADTGNLKWRRDMAGLINSSPSVAGDLVFAGSTDTKVRAFNRHTGETEWIFDTGNYVSSSPIIHNGFLFIGSGDSYMYALDAKTGSKIWEFKTEDIITAPASLHNGVLYFTSNDNSVYSVNYRTGEARMRFRTRGTAGFEPPVVAHGLIYISSINGVLTAKAGIREIPGRWQRERLWRLLWLRWGSPIPNPPAQHGTSWRMNPIGRGFMATVPAITDEAQYIGDTTGIMRAWEPTELEVKWEFQGEGEIRTAPIVAGDTVFFGTTEGMVYALNRMTGQEIWNLDLGASIELDPALAEGKLFIRTDDGRIHAIE